jgi:hypothetical protein
MNLIPKEILMSHLQRSEGAEEVSLPIDFFRDLLYQAMPRTWVGLTNKDIIEMWPQTSTVGWDDIRLIESKLKEKNT